MKKVLTMILSLTLLISMTACQTQKPAEGKYTPGTYSAQAQGFGGTVTATITTDANAVTELFWKVRRRHRPLGAQRWKRWLRLLRKPAARRSMASAARP